MRCGLKARRAALGKIPPSSVDIKPSRIGKTCINHYI